MKQIYKNLHKDDEDMYLFANDNDTRYVVDQQSYLLIYILEVLLKMNSRDEVEAFLNNEVRKENAKA